MSIAMICLRCSNEEFREAAGRVEQQFHGEMLTVETPVMECTMCGWHALDVAQADQLRRNVADEYRRKHNLLTSGAIKAMRIALEMNQVEFAKFAGVGEASIKRWETWLVQEKSSDELLRLKFRECLGHLA